MAVQRHELSIAGDLRDGAALLREMREMRVRTRDSGRERAESGAHDDLVFAASLGLWGARRLTGLCGERRVRLS